jgi:hypothetical protein
MFWKKKSQNDILFRAAVERKNLFTSLSQLQCIRVALFIRITEPAYVSSNFLKAVVYVYYDTYAALHSQELADAQNDPIKAYWRDWALSSYEGVVGDQFRTYATDATSYQKLIEKPIHPIPLLEILRDKPVFDIILQNKVNEKINELNDRIFSNDPSISGQIVELLKDEELIKSFQEPVDLSSIILKCGFCASQEKLEQINGREDAQICIFKTGEMRAGDDLEIFSCYCFECQHITKFAVDPYDFSGNAENGVEYFSSHGVELDDVKNALIYLRATGDFAPALRLISSFPAVVDEMNDL